MAGGRGNSTHGGNLDRTCQWLCHRRLYASATHKTPSNVKYKGREKTERDQFALKYINELQENILRIFTDRLHCDFNIIHGNNVIQTNRCIVRARSPRFYEALEPRFVYINDTINCILNTSKLYEQVKDFIRLLYTNLDVSHKEQLLITVILSNNHACEYTKQCYTEQSTGIAERIYEKCIVSSYNEKEDLAKAVRYDADVSPTLSDMADSGLETGSVSPHENTTSEHSSADFEESQTTGYVSNTVHPEKIREKQARKRDHKVVNEVHRCDGPNNNCSDVWRGRDPAESTPTSNEHSATCSLDTDHQQFDLSSSSTENPHKTKMHADEVFHYETQVLSDPFYESDCGSDENESFEIIDPSSVPINVENDKEMSNAEMPAKSEKLYTDFHRTENVADDSLSDAIDISTRASFKSTSNYYFIDASTLNDEIEIVTADTSKQDRQPSDKLASYVSLASIDESAGCLVEDQTYKYTAFKQTNLQAREPTGHENVAEFERELKLTEYLQPLAEPRKTKKINSATDDTKTVVPELSVIRATEKESLVVEIKETDSGESTQHSPCPDNNSNTSKDNTKDNAEDNTTVQEPDNPSREKSSAEKEKINLTTSETNANTKEDSRRPSLIRRNTFELDSDDEKLSILRQEYERRQGTLVFRSSIPQYSGHRVDGDSCYDPVSSTESSVTSLSNVQNSFIPDVQQIAGQFPASVQYQATTSTFLSYEEPKYDVDRKQVDNNYLLQQTNTGQNANVIYPVTKSASDKVIVDSNSFHLHDVSSASSTSLPVTLNEKEKEKEKKKEREKEREEKESHVDTVKRNKCIEAVPIISGGVSTSDYSKSVDSPMVRRKTESTPIVSGGSVIMHEPEIKTKPPRMSSSLTTWVVDMSDCNKNEERADNSQAGMSQSYSVTESKKSVQKSQEKHNSLGFFINLKDVDSKGKQNEEPKAIETKRQIDNGKPYCEFYVDISEKNNSTSKIRKKPEKDETTERAQKSEEIGDKKNIFSMFIDLSDPRKTIETTKTIPKRTLPAFVSKRTEEKSDESSVNKSSSGSQEDEYSQAQKSSKDSVKPSVFMFIESDSPVVRRRTLSSSRPGLKRHSWNVDKTQNVSTNGHVAKELMFRKEHKRAHSLSVDRNDMKMQTKQSSSSHSLSDAARAESLNRKDLQEQETNPNNNMDTSTEDVFEFDAKDTPPNSHVEIINEKLRVSVKQHEYKELVTGEAQTEIVGIMESKIYEDEHSEPSAWDKTCTESTEGQTRKSETFDISSGSGPSPDSDNHDYELSDLLNGEAPNIVERQPIVQPVADKISETQKSLNETIKKIESELKGPEYEKMTCDKYTTTSLDKNETSHDAKESRMDVERNVCSNFVRLSDLDKTPVYETCQMSKIATVKEDKATYRMSNSIPETSWIESKLVMSRINGPVRPISRKVPSVMSTSLPAKQKSPLEDLTNECEAEGIISESDLSSMQSSMGRSGADGSTEETETSSLAGAKPYNRLGEDLLRMFLEEINPDITIDVAGRRIRAHKCILSSRCQYFAAILSGGWIESSGNVISLQGYSYNAVHFALCHIYSGESNIPDSISIVELATLADMLCLEGLKEVIGYTLKVKYCHLFHKPCQICAVGVLECMPLAAAYGLDELYRKSLRWVTRHFVRIWPCKAFATLPRELMEKCYHQHIVHMSTENVLQTIMDCDKLLATLPNVRWAEPVFRMVSNLLETSVRFLSDNFSAVLGNENFQSLGRELTWNISRLEDNFLGAAERLPPDQACKSYSKLHKMLSSTQIDDSEAKEKWGPVFVDFLKKIQSRVEKCLVRDAARASRTTTWLKMDLELRRRIQELACLVILPHESPKRLSRHSNFLKGPRAPPTARSTPSRSLDLKRVKMAISEHNDKTTKQPPATVQPTRKIFNKPKSDPLERKIQEEKQVNNDSTIRPRSWPNKMEVKSRYLEPRTKPVPKEIAHHHPPHQEKVIVQQRRRIMISSSDSSRTSSPAMKRATEKKPLAKIKLPVKKDAKALSSDSLTESNASKANNRKDLMSKSCGITRPESPSFEQKNAEIGLSVDSLAETRNKPSNPKKRTNKMDTSMSTDSLMTELTITPKSNVSNKLSPTLNKNVTKTQAQDRAKRNSPPTQQRSPLTATRRSPRSLESSTAASRSRAAAINAYHQHGSPSLRRNLLDAAKAPDIPPKSFNSIVFPRTPSVRPQSMTVTSSTITRRERRDGNASTQGSESPSKKSSPKLSGANKPNSRPSTIASRRTTCRPPSDEKAKSKCHNAGGGGGGGSKQPTVGSRSGTFLKDEPTILKKADMNAAQANT